MKPAVKTAQSLTALVLAILFSNGLYAQSSVEITTESLSNGAVGAVYFAQMLAAGGEAPYTWTVRSGVLPPGLTLSSTGTITGVPILAGNFDFEIRVTDSSDPADNDTVEFTITVPPAITTPSLPNGIVDNVYPPVKLTLAPAVVNDFEWDIDDGDLPDGLELSSDGVISGTPAETGTFNVVIVATSADDEDFTATKAFSITIQPVLEINTNSPLPTGVAGAFYFASLTSDGPTPVTWSVISRIPPPGITLLPDGSLAGTPTVQGTFDFTVQATGGNPVQTVTKSLRVVINPALTITTPANLAPAATGTAYSVSLAASGGAPPYTWTVQGSGMPPGLSLSSAGLLSGTPTSPGNFLFSVQVSDAFNPIQQASRTFAMVVSTGVIVTTASLPPAIQNLAYSQQLQATGIAPLTWALTGGRLPAGLTLNTSGLLQGTPTTLESQSFGVTVTDSRGTIGARNFTLAVNPPVPALSMSSLPATLNPAQASQVSLTLAAPYPSALSGQLVLTYTSKAEVPSDDPMTQFSTKSRVANFTIPAGATSAVFSPSLMLLVGTVAGSIRLAANIDNGPADLTVGTVEVPALAPQLTNVDAIRTLGGIDVQITGYAPARRVTAVEFSFDVRTDAKNSSKVQRVTLTRNVDSDFGSWYRSAASTSYGASFSFVQSFSVQGDTSFIQTVTVRLVNAQGSTTSSAVSLH